MELNVYAVEKCMSMHEDQSILPPPPTIHTLFPLYPSADQWGEGGDIEESVRESSWEGQGCGWRSVIEILSTRVLSYVVHKVIVGIYK